MKKATVFYDKSGKPQMVQVELKAALKNPDLFHKLMKKLTGQLKKNQSF